MTFARSRRMPAETFDATVDLSPAGSCSPTIAGFSITRPVRIAVMRNARLFGAFGRNVQLR
jgi:hypothetical protein